MSREEEIIKAHFYSKDKHQADEYDYADKKICKHNIQRESCRNCLFEVLCSYQDMCKRNNVRRGGTL